MELLDRNRLCVRAEIRDATADQQRFVKATPRTVSGFYWRRTQRSVGVTLQQTVLEIGRTLQSFRTRIVARHDASV